MSHVSTINLVESLGKDFDKPVMEWKQVAEDKMSLNQVAIRKLIGQHRDFIIHLLAQRSNHLQEKKLHYFLHLHHPHH